MTLLSELALPSAEMPSFFTLPAELRNQIYREYMGSWDAVVEYNRSSASFELIGIPDYSLRLTSRTLHVECTPLISQSFSGKLVLKDTKVRRERGFGYVNSLDILGSLCPAWLLKRTTVVAINQGTTGMLMTLPWYKLNSLREVHLEGNSLPLANYYPCALSARAKQTQEDQVFEGRYDTWCVNGYDTWSQVPNPIAEGRVRVMTIRRGTVRGVSLIVRVEHKSDRAEVLERYINSVLQQKVILTTKQSVIATVEAIN